MSESPVSLPFRDRREAGRLLARRLESQAGEAGLIVLGLPRGGVPVGFEVAKHLDAPLDVFVVRKLGVPGQEELAMGAIATGGVRVLNDDVLGRIPHARAALERVTETERRELERREHSYREGRPPPDLAGHTVILTDDGLATGATMRAAVRAVRQLHAGRCIVAVPVGAYDTCRELEREADDVVCLATPEPFYGVGQFYRDFSPTTDDEVCRLLKRVAMEDFA